MAQDRATAAPRCTARGRSRPPCRRGSAPCRTRGRFRAGAPARCPRRCPRPRCASPCAVRARRHQHAAALRVLDRVGHQVADDAPQQDGIGQHGARRDVHAGTAGPWLARAAGTAAPGRAAAGARSTGSMFSLILPESSRTRSNSESNSAFTALVDSTILGAISCTSSGSLPSQSAYRPSACTGWRMSCAALARNRFLISTASSAACVWRVSDSISWLLRYCSSKFRRCVSCSRSPAWRSTCQKISSSAMTQ